MCKLEAQEADAVVATAADVVRSMIKSDTLLAVPGAGSSTGLVELLPPLLNGSFQMDAFFTGAVGTEAVDVDSTIGVASDDEREALLITLAKFWTARAFSSLSSSRAEAVLLFLAPRLPRFFVDRLLPSTSFGNPVSPSPSTSTLNSSASVC